MYMVLLLAIVKKEHNQGNYFLMKKSNINF